MKIRLAVKMKQIMISLLSLREYGIGQSFGFSFLFFQSFSLSVLQSFLQSKVL